jgi:hypothetical protein
MLLSIVNVDEPDFVNEHSCMQADSIRPEEK